MMFQDCAAGGHDLLKAQFARQKSRHRRLVGAVEHRAGRAADRAASSPNSKAANRSKSGGSNSNCIARLQSSFAATLGAAARPGQAHIGSAASCRAD